jgi:hypothetical protein
MNNLTEHQRNFILETFFKNEQYVGWKNIANKLLEIGKCIIPGDINTRLWVGGIGNFISIKETSDEFVGCIEYHFDLKEFLTSEYYKDISNCYLQDLNEKVNKLETELEELLKLA